VVQALDVAVAAGETDRQTAEGESGNPIVILTRRIEGAANVRAVWARWSEAGLVDAFRESVESRVDDEGVLHLRIDKQKAFQGMLSLAPEADTIDVQVKLKAYPAKPEEIRRVARLLVAEAS
jgi:RNA binding exosome subunit